MEKKFRYNNLVDIDAAIQFIREFDEISFAIIKHTNVCGAASRPSLHQAWKDALAVILNLHLAGYLFAMASLINNC